jgi:hypothetical protein
MEQEGIKTYFIYYRIPEIKEILNYDVLEKILQKKGLKKTNMNKKYIDFVYAVGRAYNNLFSIKTTLKNIINDISITRKNNLYVNSLKKNKTLTLRYFPETYEFNPTDMNKYKKLFDDPNKVWILKKNNLMVGLGNHVVKNYEEFIDIVKKIKDDFIISQYITNPLLIDKKKFHIRMNMINFIDKDKKVNTFFCKYGQIATAKEEYTNSNFFNGAIHDSHFSKTERDIIFPFDFQKEFGIEVTKKVFEKMVEIIKYVTTFYKLENYPENKNGFTVNGCDFMITDKDGGYQVKLLEINDYRTVHKYQNKKNKLFYSNYLLKNIYNEVISKVFDLEPVIIKEKFLRIA